jgi:hypothetical protein
VAEIVAKSPTKAMARSLALPGWGQFYNGKKFKGTLVAAVEVGSAVAFFIRRYQINKEVEVVGQPPKRNLFLLSTIGVVFYSVVDAFVDAHLDGFDWGQLKYEPERRVASITLRHTF